MRTLTQALDHARDAEMLAKRQAMQTGTTILTTDEEDLVVLMNRVKELERYLFTAQDRIKELQTQLES